MYSTRSPTRGSGAGCSRSAALPSSPGNWTVYGIPFGHGPSPWSGFGARDVSSLMKASVHGRRPPSHTWSDAGADGRGPGRSGLDSGSPVPTDGSLHRPCHYTQSPGSTDMADPVPIGPQVMASNRTTDLLPLRRCGRTVTAAPEHT